MDFMRGLKYALYDYKANYDRLKTIPVSGPHLKRDRKKLKGNLVECSHPNIIFLEQCYPGVVDYEYPETTIGYGGTRRGLESKSNMGYPISRYMRSQEGSTHYYESKMAMDRIRAYNHNRLGLKKEIWS